MSRRAVLLVAAGLCSGPAVASGQTPQQPAPGAAGPATQTVVAGKEFDRGGSWRYWFGDGYRKAWTTPVELPVLDLADREGRPHAAAPRWEASRRRAWP